MADDVRGAEEAGEEPGDGEGLEGEEESRAPPTQGEPGQPTAAEYEAHRRTHCQGAGASFAQHRGAWRRLTEGKAVEDTSTRLCRSITATLERAATRRSS